MNDIQQALVGWVKQAYDKIDEQVKAECDKLGFKPEDFESGKAKLLSNLTEGENAGWFVIDYGAEIGERKVRVLTVEFNMMGYRAYGHRKILEERTKIIAIR